MALLAPFPDPTDVGTINAYNWIGSLVLNFLTGEITYQRVRHRSAEAAAAGKPPLSIENITIPPEGLPAQYGPAPLITPATYDDAGNELTPAVYGDPPLIRPAVPGLPAIIAAKAAAFGELRGAVYEIEKSDPANAGWTEVA